ncbi:MAG: hypothetical protein ACRDPW_07080 [Mycobacteriales bacterium]
MVPQRHTGALGALIGLSSTTPKVSLRNRDELSRAYQPGVTLVCQAVGR